MFMRSPKEISEKKKKKKLQSGLQSAPNRRREAVSQPASRPASKAAAAAAAANEWSEKTLSAAISLRSLRKWRIELLSIIDALSN